MDTMSNLFTLLSEAEAKLAKIEEIARDAFNDPDTLDINLYRAQALAKIYQMFIYDTKEV